MPYRGVWKWLPRTKRKRAEAEEVEDDEVVAEEDEEMAAEDEEDEEEVAAEEEDEEAEEGEGEEDDEEEEAEEEEDDEEEDEVVHLPDFPRPIIYGRRSTLDGKRWTCKKCKHVNLPSRHAFVDLPAFECGDCHARVRRNFRFSYGNLAANGCCPIGQTLDQGDTDDCLLFALTKATEMTDQIYTFLSGSNVVIPTLNPYDLKATFEASREAAGICKEKINYKDDAAVATMFEIMETDGIQDKKRKHTSKIGGVEEVHGSFEDIATEIANGYPLVVWEEI